MCRQETAQSLIHVFPRNNLKNSASGVTAALAEETGPDIETPNVLRGNNSIPLHGPDRTRPDRTRPDKVRAYCRRRAKFH